MMTIKDLYYTYKGKNGGTVLHDINLKLDKGFTFLVGENGSGKTTLIKLITGIFDAAAGSVDAGGVEVGAPEYRRKISYLPQVFDIYPGLRVREALHFIAGIKGVSDKQFANEIREISERTGIAGFMNKKMKQCSEGMRRRVGIASTLLGNPEIVIMDEPTAGIDPKERIAFYKTVKDCFENKTVLISTHVLSDVDYLADNVAMLVSGFLAYSGSYDEFRHTLDGRVYSLSCTERELGLLETEYMVLSTDKTDGAYLCHVMPKDGGEPDLEKVVPNMEDVWLYYERKV